jgi:hypothetical protein
LRPLFDRDRVKEWAANNAYTLTFIAVFFVITWGFILIDTIKSGGR